MSPGKKGGSVANNTNKKNHVGPFGILIVSSSRERNSKKKKQHILTIMQPFLDLQCRNYRRILGYTHSYFA